MSFPPTLPNKRYPQQQGQNISGIHFLDASTDDLARAIPSVALGNKGVAAPAPQNIPIPKRKPPVPQTQPYTMKPSDKPWEMEGGDFNDQDAPRMKRGGLAEKMADGGEVDSYHHSGLFNSSGAGRTDILNREVPAGGYVIPADVVSGLGEGNTMAGSNVIDRMMNTGPYGMKLEHRGGHGDFPRLPTPPRPASQGNGAAQYEKKGGAATGAKVIVAGGEHYIPPEAIQAKFGDLNRGHKVLDAFVKHVRGKTIKTLQKLPAPKK